MAVKGKTNNPNGRPPNVPNRATTNAREAIAQFVEGNVDRLNRLLDAIENGIPESKAKAEDGTEVVSKWLVKPDPMAAHNAIMSVVEYHIPKLSRQDTNISGKVELGISGILDSIDGSSADIPE